MKEIVLEFKGYWTESSAEFLPDQPGVYCVYRGAYDLDGRRVVLKELLYIGEAGNVRETVRTHELKSAWLEHVKNGETLCYSYSPILFDRNRAEAALIHQHKPPENTDFLYDFPYDDTAVFITGKTLLLSDCFVVLEQSLDERERVS